MYITCLQILVFISYACISTIVFETFCRSRKYYNDKFFPNFLIITYVLFLMLCAITHLLSITGGLYFNISLTLCAIDSLIAACTTIYMRPSIIEYISMRHRP